MRVEEVMTRAVLTCSRYRMLDEVARMMWEQDLGAVPVVNDQGQPVAMITDRDACMAALTQGKPLSEILVHSAMSKVLFTCHRDDQLGAAERTMRVHQVRRLPVVDDRGVLVGMLSLADIAVARLRSPFTRATERLIGDVAVTLAAICRRPLPSQTPATAREDHRPSFEVHDSPSFHEGNVDHHHKRMPPPTLASALSHFRA